jgi:hypothetical protein
MILTVLFDSRCCNSTIENDCARGGPCAVRAYARDAPLEAEGATTSLATLEVAAMPR